MRMINVVVYADNPITMVEVTKAKPLSDMMMLVTFTTGETRLFDCTRLHGSVFEPLHDEAIFSNPKIVCGAVTWNDESIDVAPEYMYAESFEYNTQNIISA